MKKIKPELKNLSAATSVSKGEINLQWDSVHNAVSYIIEFSCSGNSNNAKWKILDIISDSRYTVKNLKSNKKYFFRIASADENGRMMTGADIAVKVP